MLSWLLPIAAFAAAVALLAVSGLSFQRLRAYMDSLTPDGDAESVSPQMFAALAPKLRLAGALFVVASAALVVVRGWLERQIGTLLDGTATYVRDTVHDGVDAMRAETRAHVTTLAVIVVAGIALRAQAIQQPVNYDEAFTYINYATRPWLITWANYSDVGNQIFHSLLAHVSILAFGSAPWALRVPAFVAGCLAIPLSYVVGRRFADRNAALIVAGLVATTQVLIVFSVCARGYSTIVALFLFVLICGYDLIVTRCPRAWPLVVVCSALGFFTIPVFLYAFGGVMGWLFVAGLRDRSNPALRVTALGHAGLWTIALVMACYAPAFATSRLNAAVEYGAASSTLARFVAGLGASLVPIAADLTRGMPAAMVASLIAAIVIGLIRLRRAPAGAVFALPLVLWPLAAILVQRIVAPPRVWIYLLPAAFVFAAAGAVATLEFIERRLAVRTGALIGPAIAVIVGAVAVQAVVHAPVQYTEWNSPEEILDYSDLDQVSDYLKTSLRPQDMVVAKFPLDYPFEYYLRIKGVAMSHLRHPPERPDRVVVLANDAAREPLAKVVDGKHLDARALGSPHLLRTFVYSSLYEFKPDADR